MALRLKEGLTFYFCRHGETEANVEKRFQGRTKDTPLTAKGLEQTTAIASILKRDAPNFAALSYVCSPLPRARTTMELIRDKLGLPRDDFALDPRLMEIDLGLWDGLTHEEARALNPAAFDAREADKWNVHAPNGENYEEVAARATSFVTHLTRDTFAVAHGAFTRILRGLFQGLDWKQMSALDEPQGCIFRVRGSEVVRLDA